jgi:hypothetical protein
LPALAHRVIPTADAVMGGRTPIAILTELLETVSIPVVGSS